MPVSCDTARFHRQLAGCALQSGASSLHFQRLTMPYLIGVDIGTSSTKTALWRDDGVLMAEASAPYPLHRPHPTWAEQSALDWWQAACHTIREVLGRSGVKPADIAGVGVDGLGWSLVAIDGAGEPVFPAMIWLDRRAEAEAAHLRSLPEAEYLVNLVANPLDAAYITPKLRWLQIHEPSLYRGAAQFLTSTGFIVHRLCGALTCDTTQAYGFHCFDIRRERWDAEAARLLGIPLEKLPPLFASCDRVGVVSPKAASLTGLAAGTPVIAGALDAAAGAFGSGVARVGQTSDQGGTAFGLSLCVDKVIVEPRLIFSHHVVPGTYIFQGGTVGGSVLPWFKEALGQPEALAAQLLGGSAYSLMSDEAVTAPPGANGLLFLPYIAGERSPLWNSDARGVFFGLSSRTTRADILRAIMEGCAYAVYHNVRVMEESGVGPKEWIGIGGAANSPVWCQIKADISNRPFTVARREDGGTGDNTLGLAVMVGQAVGLYPDLVTPIERFLPQRTVYLPSLERHSLYARLFEFYLQLSNALLPQFHQWAQVVQSG